MNYWVLIYRCAWVMLVILCVIGLTCIFLPKCRQYQEWQQKREQLQTETDQIESSIKKLQQQQEQLQTDPAFVERTARELGMAKPGETIFKVQRETPQPDTRNKP